MCSAEKSVTENIFTRNSLKHVYGEKSALPRKWEIPLEFVRKHPSQLTKEEKWTKILEKPATKISNCHEIKNFREIVDKYIKFVNIFSW